MHPQLTIFLSVALGAAVYTDLREQRIPNALTLGIACCGLLFHALGPLPPDTSGDAHGVGFALAGLGAGLGLMLPPYLFGVMGGGDVKLMAALGAVLGPRLVLEAFAFTSLAGGVYALAVLLLRHRPLLGRMLRNFRTALWLLLAGRRAEYAPVRGGEALPRLCYGLAIAAGAGATLLREAAQSGAWRNLAPEAFAAGSPLAGLF